MIYESLRHRGQLTSAQLAGLMDYYCLVMEKRRDQMMLVKSTFGDHFFNTISTAYLNDSIEDFEREMKIPPRSGKAVLALAGDVLNAHFKRNPVFVEG